MNHYYAVNILTFLTNVMEKIPQEEILHLKMNVSSFCFHLYFSFHIEKGQPQPPSTQKALACETKIANKLHDYNIICVIL